MLGILDFHNYVYTYILIYYVHKKNSLQLTNEMFYIDT